MTNLNGAVALVTGGAHRVGKVIALALAQAGADIALHFGSNIDEAASTAHEIEGLGRAVRTYQADISNWTSAQEMAQRVLADFGHVDVLVNNASSFVRASYLDTTESQYDLALDVNIKGPFALSQPIARAMIERQKLARAGGAQAPLADNHFANYGHIINIVDEGVLGPRDPYGAHGVSKSALLALTQLQAAELGPYIRVNSVCPGPVLRPEGYSQERWHAQRANNPLNTVGTAGQVAECVLFLITGPQFINGDCIMLEGGRRWR